MFFSLPDPLAYIYPTYLASIGTAKYKGFQVEKACKGYFLQEIVWLRHKKRDTFLKKNYI